MDHVKVIRLREGGKYHLQPLHTNTLLCKDTRGTPEVLNDPRKHMLSFQTDEVCEWCMESLEDLMRFYEGHVKAFSG